MELTRVHRRTDGIISTLASTDSDDTWVTLEHSFDGQPKIPNGTYVCRRGVHRIPWRSIHNDSFIEKIGAKLINVDGQWLIEFETFEITGVTGHSNILFHWGNYQEDSDGCVLTGQSFGLISGGSRAMVTNARASFARFMASKQDVDSFPLTVSG